MFCIHDVCTFLFWVEDHKMLVFYPIKTLSDIGPFSMSPSLAEPSLVPRSGGCEQQGCRTTSCSLPCQWHLLGSRGKGTRGSGKPQHPALATFHWGFFFWKHYRQPWIEESCRTGKQNLVTVVKGVTTVQSTDGFVCREVWFSWFL